MASWRRADAKEAPPMKRVLAAIAIVFSVSALAHAQNPPPARRVFVSAGAFTATTQVSRTEVIQPFGEVGFPNVSGTTVGGSLGVGGFLAPRWSVRFEYGAEGTRHGSTNFSGPLGTLTFTRSTQLDERLKTGSVLLGYHTGSRGMASLTFLAGMVLVHRRQHLLQQSSIQPPPLPPVTVPVLEPRTEIVNTEFRPGPAVGMDLVLAVWPRFAVVPEARMLVFGGNWDLRPGMSVRIGF
jgi:hypothetical protein